MGNASGGTNASTSGSWFSYLGEGASADRLPVVLKLIDARNVQLRAWEELYGIVRVGSDNIARVRRGSPAQFPVETATVLTLEFQATRGCGSELVDARVVGEVQLSMQHVAARCGRCLYHLWLPLRPPHSQRSPSPDEFDDGPSGSLRQFDHAVASAAREPRWAMVCLSMTQAGSPEGAADLYERAPAEDRTRRFPGLMQSHAQHARMLQALYRQARKLNVRRPDQLGNTTQQHFRGPLVEQSLAAAPAMSLGAATDISRLQEEIASTTSEANNRMAQAAEAVQTLEERLDARKAEHERLREEASQFEHNSEALALESERLSLQLERRARDRASAEGPEDAEAEQLRREAQVLKEQKDALMLILEDLYGASGDRESEGAGSLGGGGGRQSAPEALGGGGDEVAQPDVREIERLAPPSPAFTHAAHGQSWENLLPRPSMLFLDEGDDGRMSFR